MQDNDTMMKRYRVSSSGIINARPSIVYAVLSDYRTHHPRIVPPEYFLSLEVKEGGIGAGTRTHLKMRILGMEREIDHVISEPDPGRVLVESDVDGSSVTTFTVEPANEEGTTNLIIATEIVARPGLAGIVERWLSSRMLPRIYRKELALIEQYVAQLPG